MFTGPISAALVTADSDTYAIWPIGYDPRDVRNTINDVLRNTHGPHLWFPSLVNDSDFENNVIATDWPDVGTPATSDFVTTNTAAIPAFLGERTLSLIANAADEGVHSLVFRVHQDQQLLVSVFIRVNVGTFDVELYDETGSATVTPIVTVDEEAFTETRFVRNVPTSSEEMRIRFRSNANLDDASISPPVIVQPTSGYAYPAPSWLVNPEQQIKRALVLEQGYGTDVNEAYRPLTRGKETSFYQEEVWRADRWLNPSHVWAKPVSGRPVYFEVHRPFAELTVTQMASTNTTACDEDYVAAAVVARLMKHRGDDDWKDWAREADKLAKVKGYGDIEGTRIRQNATVYV